MKLLRLKVSGLALFEKDLDISFMASQRVTLDNAETMYELFDNVYQNNVVSIVGINASGKTSLLKTLSFAFSLLNNEPLNKNEYREILDATQTEEKVIFDSYFLSGDKIYWLNTVIEKKDEKLVITAEELMAKAVSKVKSKKTIFDFDKAEQILIRKTNEAFLLDDVSIMVAFNKQQKESIFMANMLEYTNVNQLNVIEDFPAELIAFFDPSIEYLKVKQDKKGLDIRLKFKKSNEIILNQLPELNRYLSSGTIKGINIFIQAIKTFKTGGYLIVDELENHFNSEITHTLIRFYKDSKINQNGAMLIFTTHYAELLDDSDRNDSIYLVKNNGGISATNLSKLLKRNDMKKSEVYQSGYLEGTVPMYEAYMDLKRVLLNMKKEG